MSKRSLLAFVLCIHVLPPVGGRKGDFQGGNHVVHDGFSLERRVLVRVLAAEDSYEKNKIREARRLLYQNPLLHTQKKAASEKETAL